MGNHTIHYFSALDDLFCFVLVVLVDDDVAGVAHHDTVERTLIALIMDLDILRMLPMNIGVMIKGGPDLISNNLLTILIAHRKGWIDYQPSQHVERPRIPGLGDTRAVHLQH